MQTILLSGAALAAACIAFHVGGIHGTILCGIAICWLCNTFFMAFLRAGPRTQRQVPPQPIARCQQLSALQLSQAYRDGTLRCIDVVDTFIAHIRRVNPYLNIMVFECFDEARQTAAEADVVWAAWRADRSQPEPSWLLGVPCTIKECMQCIGCPNSSGHPARKNNFSLVDSPVVHNFREAGAVILGVTNTSELCMWLESGNYNYGITCNPYDTRCLVGGSSGGEGAAAGAVYSTFSLGSDIGGSIRMPAFFNGVYGHKPSPHYISNCGQHPGATASANHYMATGPITRFPEDIAPLCKVAARGGFLLDSVKFPPASPMGDLVDLKTKPMRVFALEDYGLIGIYVSQAQIDAVHDAAEVLRRQYGATVTYVNVRYPERCTGGRVPSEFSSFPMILSMWLRVLSKDPSETKFATLMSEGHDVERVNWFAEYWHWLRGRSQHTLPAITLCVIEACESLLPTFICNHEDTLSPFRKTLLELLGEDGIIICPTFPTAAPRHHYPLWNPFQFQYTAAFNVLQLPATACPVWQHDMRQRRKARSVFESKEARLPADDHLPKGVQIVAAANRDALCLSVAVALDKALGGYRYPSWARLEGLDF